MIKDHTPMSKSVVILWVFVFALIGALYLTLPGSKLARSDEDILLGFRIFDGEISTNRLAFSGAALSFLKDGDLSTYVPYYFAFEDTGFTEIDDTTAVTEFQQRHGVEFQISSGVDLDSCVSPRPDSIATEDGVSLIFPTLCQIEAGVDGGASGIIGVVFPADYRDLDLDGDAVCRAEVAHWLTLDGFEVPEIVLCAIVDQTFVPGTMPRFWMDVIFYQHYAGELSNMQAETRNFQSIN